MLDTTRTILKEFAKHGDPAKNAKALAMYENKLAEALKNPSKDLESIAFWREAISIMKGE